ncbi:methyltransferase [Marinobacter antarcticus]|uniref:Methyltransferase n=1 Tax=Marinobacter antarcticus TaxID=564117 RepID=A0A831R3A0_9GAMM|nr:methyltransferase [Marinobacter antarcticus]HEA51445.1 methyltransferase [Marinobacter antarcticus]
MSVHEPAESYYLRWQTLNDWLVEHQPIWQPAPFTEPRPAWIQRYPGLAHMAKEFTDAECDELADAPGACAEKVSRHLPSLALYCQMVNLPELSPAPSDVMSAMLPESRATDMPGRKREQSGAFAAALKPLRQPILDWCCGKGYLSRTLAAQSGKPVEGYEWDQGLVTGGNRLATRFDDSVHIRCQNVMAQNLAMPVDTHGVALHACGDLHRQLLRRGVAAALPRLSLSPCCYHQTVDKVDGQTIERRYHTLSERTLAYNNRLMPDRDDLRLAVRETVTAPARVRKQTRILNQWRLGFDGLQRSLRNVDQYLPVPSRSPQRIQNGFPAFCRWAAEKKQLCLPERTDFDDWLAFGEKRYEEVRRYELIRHLFRRPLELWLVLDYAVFLEEQGYRVRLGHFCARSLTPRNLLLDAVRVCGIPPVRHSHL